MPDSLQPRAAPGLTLSDLLAKLRNLEQDSPERDALLRRLAEEVQTGRYRVDSQELARKILDEHTRS